MLNPQSSAGPSAVSAEPVIGERQALTIDEAGQALTCDPVMREVI